METKTAKKWVKIKSLDEVKPGDYVRLFDHDKTEFSLPYAKGPLIDEGDVLSVGSSDYCLYKTPRDNPAIRAGRAEVFRTFVTSEWDRRTIGDSAETPEQVKARLYREAVELREKAEEEARAKAQAEADKAKEEEEKKVTEAPSFTIYDLLNFPNNTARTLWAQLRSLGYTKTDEVRIVPKVRL